MILGMESVTFTLPAQTLETLRMIAERDKISITQLMRAAVVKEVYHRGAVCPPPPVEMAPYEGLRLV